MAHISGSRAWLIVGTSLVALGAATPVLAQTNAAAATTQGGKTTSADAAENDADPSRDIIVTAQKRSENIQSVPISMSAFSGQELAAQKVETGGDLMKAVPNLTFSKSNFSGYNISIRGIGTKSISTTSDPGVAVAYNNIGLIRNRLFEQEYFDVERVEVLRGPQGTLYGRNATAGVVNLITAKPKFDVFEGSLKGEVGNYDSRRLVGMLNIPIIDDIVSIRAAGSITQRQGYDYNSITRNRVNGRDLWSTRLTVGLKPTPNLRANFIWERFHEDDNRSRTGKQLCHRDDNPETIGSTPTAKADSSFPEINELRGALFSTGCKAGSLYDDGAYGTPNGLALASVAALGLVNYTFPAAFDANGNPVGFLDPIDPYGGMKQSRDLREIASFRDPVYRAKSDILEFNVDWDVSPGLTLSSQTAYDWDSVYSFQDFNRFNTVPVFRDSTEIAVDNGTGAGGYRNSAPGGVFCDPQIGCSSSFASFDVSSASSKQFSQEFRLQSSFSGPVNFSIGGNYTWFKTQEDYYVFSNVLTALAMSVPLNQSGNQTECAFSGFLGGFSPLGAFPIRNSFCPYIDPNPVESINGDGHNYFRSSNPYTLHSLAAFGEAYWQIQPSLKLTAGLRYTEDRKTFTPVPSQLLIAPTFAAGGITGTGYPADPDIKLKWGEFTGRLGLDWSPQLGITDRTLVYGFYSRGYKGGGANPPSPGFATVQEMLDAGVLSQEIYETFNSLSGFFPILQLTGVEYNSTFRPEFVNSFEIGTKNTLLGGRLTLNGSAFFYDYKDYQVSQIRDRTAVNENFDATIYGAELQADFAVSRRLRLNANLGYLHTRISDGEKSIDTINRTLGDPNYTVVKPWVQLPSNCVIPTPVAESWLQTTDAVQSFWEMCGGLGGLLGGFLGQPVTDPATGLAYDQTNYPQLNGGAGLYTDLSGNELPNSPHWTVNVGAQYTVPFGEDWSATVRGDGYWQAQSFSRVYNYLPYDRLRGWTNFNISLRVDGPEGLSLEAYVKNLLDSTPITDAFLNADDAGLTTNVFTLDPRIIGFSVSKKF